MMAVLILSFIALLALPATLTVDTTAKVSLMYPMEMGHHNVLVCFVDTFLPPVVNITWLKNGQLVSQGVDEVTFYPSVDGTFRKFSHLLLVPEDGDVYVCQVEHRDLDRPLQETWTAKAPAPVSETMENTVCALGLLVAILGIVIGTHIFVKAKKMRSDTCGRGAQMVLNAVAVNKEDEDKPLWSACISSRNVIKDLGGQYFVQRPFPARP